jgi:hypothetical protein
MNRKNSAGKKPFEVLRPISLPKPKHGRGTSLHEALKRRKTNRFISNKAFSRQMVSNLLWSACGVNRADGPFGFSGKTAASASNSQEVDLYVAMKEGVFRYEAAGHRLLPIVPGDLRGLAIGRGQGKAGAEAPVRLIYVVDMDKFRKAGFQEPGLRDPETQKAYSYVDTGLIAGNVYMFAASQGLAAWFHNCNKEEVSAKLALGESQHVLFGQTVGYPEKR